MSIWCSSEISKSLSTIEYNWTRIHNRISNVSFLSFRVLNNWLTFYRNNNIEIIRNLLEIKKILTCIKMSTSLSIEIFCINNLPIFWASSIFERFGDFRAAQIHSTCWNIILFYLKFFFTSFVFMNQYFHDKKKMYFNQNNISIKSIIIFVFE